MKQYTATANDEGVRLSRFVQSVTRQSLPSIGEVALRSNDGEVSFLRQSHPSYNLSVSSQAPRQLPL